MNLGDIQKWICLKAGWKSYAVLAFIGCIPIAVAFLIGVAESAESKDIPSAISNAFTKACRDFTGLTGFRHRWNWMLYPIFLPVALYALQRTARMIFGHATNSPLREPEYAPFRKSVEPLLDNGRILGVCLLLNLIFHVVDGYQFVKTTIDWPNINECPNDLDWGWYGLVFDDVSQVQVIGLYTLTTFEQFLLTTFALFILILIYIFNRKYISTFYVRFRHTSEMDSIEHTKKIAFVLDFKDDNLQFGLGGMARIFNWELMLAIIIGIIMLFSRYANVESGEITDLWRESYITFQQVLTGADPKEISLEAFRKMLPDAGQWLLVIGWLVLAFVIMRPASVKLLPLRLHLFPVSTKLSRTILRLLPHRAVSPKDGRVSYLMQFIHPDSDWGRILARDPTGDQEKKQRSDLIDEIAKKFGENTFWPTGNQRAQEGIFFSVVIWLLLLFPINPIYNPKTGFIAVITMIVFSLFLTGFYLYIHKYRLKRVHETLIADKKTL